MGSVHPTKEESFQTFRTRLEELRADHEQNIQEACDEIDIDRRIYTAWTHATMKNGKPFYSVPSIEKALQVADAYNVSLDYLFGRADYTSLERDIIGQETGLSDESIKALQRINKTEPQNVKDCINWIIRHHFLQNVAQVLLKLIDSQNDLLVCLDPDTGKPYIINSATYAELKAKHPSKFQTEPLQLFDKDLYRQTELNKISDLFKLMCSCWDKDHNPKPKRKRKTKRTTA